MIDTINIWGNNHPVLCIFAVVIFAVILLLLLSKIIDAFESRTSGISRLDARPQIDIGPVDGISDERMVQMLDQLDMDISSTFTQLRAEIRNNAIRSRETTQESTASQESGSDPKTSKFNVGDE